ncbi:MAG: membrane protein insertase YidC [Clostridia bacterium]|nr:membrane protein insertase YidC [Clostridia bacterium]
MFKQKRKFTGRITLIAVIVLLLATLLTGCGGAPAPTLNFNADLIAQRWDKDYEDGTLEHGLKSTELSDMAKMFADAFSGGFDAREALIAASRGYDITAEDYDPTADYSKDKGVDLKAVQAVVKKANATAVEKGSANAFTDADLKGREYKNDKGETVKEKGILNRLTEADVDTLIEAFKTSVVIGPTDLWGNLLTGVGAVLNFLTRTLGFGNYVLGICLFAIIIEVLMLPFAIKQQKNSIKQAKLRPKEMAIKNKYKGRNDQPTMQKMQAEIQELYQRENFSPYSGCLPLLIQMPIIFALYYIVVDPLQYVLAQGAGVSAALSSFASASPAAGGLGLTLSSTNGTIELLSAIKQTGADWLSELQGFQYFSNGDALAGSVGDVANMIPDFNIGPINFGMIPGFTAESWILLLVPVFTFLTYFATAKLNRKFMYQSVANEGADARQIACSNTMMDVTMPAMSAFFTMAVPSVIGIYWAFRSWVGLLKTFIMSKVMPLPTFTEEDYKAAAREMAGKQSKKKTGSASSGKVQAKRSLHYIDDEDFEDTRERGLARRAAIEEKERMEQEAKAQKTPFAAAPLKKEEKDDKKKKNEAVTEADASAEEQSNSVDAAPEAQENDNNKDEV